MSESQPVLTPKQTKTDSMKGFHETARWDVSLNGENIGEVWRGNDHRGRTCWMMDVPSARSSLISSAVVGGYAATTRKGVVAELMEWHRNKSHSFELGGVFYHCATRRDRGYEMDINYLAEYADGLRRWVQVTNVIESKPHMGAMAMEGWYACSKRGHRLLQSLYAASEEEALMLIQTEMGLLSTPEERRNIHASPIRVTGSLIVRPEPDGNRPIHSAP